MTDEELATVLLASRTPHLVAVWCVRHNDIVAKVYSGVPDREGPILAVRGWSARSEDWHGRDYRGGAVSQPTTVFALDDSAGKSIAVRCGCGSGLFDRAEIVAALSVARSTGKPQEIAARRSFMTD